MDRTDSGAFTPPGFRAKWRGVSLTERAAAQSHFIDLCRALGVPVPTEYNAPRSATEVAVA